jgi:flagellar hook-basal body complex protein FliE
MGLEALLQSKGGGAGAGIGGGQDGGQDFGSMLDAAVKGVDAKQNDADVLMRGLATGENVDIHGTMIALEEANIALRTMGSVRDKVVDAWQAIWNMPV